MVKETVYKLAIAEDEYWVKGIYFTIISAFGMFEIFHIKKSLKMALENPMFDTLD